ncbi:hypothetical protein PEBR_30614 [Penicillium brasilianum]|uniref:Rhodopsin domain-containing protein n=1 Tax=Penicillium brasilianum TaxID=104259 RepID=A0A1S9RFN3_PENBI|nr:hypothetical protein PEBR_30614 [Penicillium brasilianum]
MSLSPRNSVYNAGPQLLRDVWGLTAVAILIIVLRIVAKLRLGKFGADDILMISALCLAVIGSIMITLAIKLGFSQELSSVNTLNVSKIIMYDYLAQTFGLAGGALGRISFIIFIIGLLVQKRSQRIILWILVALQVIVNSIFIIILFVQCPGHASAIWDHSGKVKCWDLHVQAYYGYFQGAFNSATDLYLAVFSTCIFWNLNVKVRVKVGLVALLGLGIFAMIASIIKTVQTRVLAISDSEPTTATIHYDRWIYIETYLVIITASIPCIRSLLRPTNSRKISSRDTHELSSRYAVSSTRSRIRRRDSSLDGKRIIDVSEGDLSINDEVSPGYQHNVTPHLGESRESVAICV